MTQKERMLAGLPYKAWNNELEEERNKCKEKIYRFNMLSPTEYSNIPQILNDILGKTGKNIWIEPPFHCDYGQNTEIGENFYANYNLTILDVAKVTIGDNVMIAPNVSIYTAAHPIHPIARNTGYECGMPINIGNNVWIGGNSVILPSVTIGDNTVIGAGSVVTKNIPSNVIAAGNPCRIIRKITDDDIKYYFKDKEFDVPIE